MKFSISTAALALTWLSDVHAAECTIPTTYGQEYGLAMRQCAIDTGLSIVWSNSTYDNFQSVSTKFCASASCLQALDILQKIWPEECTVNGYYVRTKVIDPILAVCNGTTTLASSGSADSSSSADSAKIDSAATGKTVSNGTASSEQ